jgi:cysteine desulfurase/selenocysteine lyase
MTDEFDIKHDFGVFNQIPDLAYFDSASTTLVPRQAVSTTTSFLDSVVASARRGAHSLAVQGGVVVENTRTSLATFLETDRSQISFQKSIPSAVASFVYGFDWKTAGKNKIVIAQSEENSILVSLLRSANVLGLDVDIVPVTEKGGLRIDELDLAVNENTGLVAVSHVSPGPGARNPIQTIAKITHDRNALLLTDATRSAGLTSETLTTLGADILVMSANIGLMGPPGLAIQWIDKTLGETHKPGILGGSSVSNVKDELLEIALQPDKFEPGFLNVPAIAGLNTSLEYLTKLHSQGLIKHINKLSKYLLKKLKEIDGLIIYGEPDEKSTIFGLNLNPEDGISCHDVAMFLDESNIAVRSGVLCAHPLIQAISGDGIIQASIHAYNSLEDIDRLAGTLTAIASELL